MQADEWVEIVDESATGLGSDGYVIVNTRELCKPLKTIDHEIAISNGHYLSTNLITDDMVAVIKAEANGKERKLIQQVCERLQKIVSDVLGKKMILEYADMRVENDSVENPFKHPHHDGCYVRTITNVGGKGTLFYKQNLIETVPLYHTAIFSGLDRLKEGPPAIHACPKTRKKRKLLVCNWKPERAKRTRNG